MSASDAISQPPGFDRDVDQLTSDGSPDRANVVRVVGLSSRRQRWPRRASARAVIAGRTGWKFDYAGELLFVDPDANDTFDSAKQSYDPVWHSRLHGNDVTIHIQISENRHCRSAERYARERIA